MNNGIKFLIMDVDGTLTDGKIYVGNDGETFKAFNVKDGYGIKNILRQHGITPIILTSRESTILKNRCNELEILELYQGVNDKLDTLEKIISTKSIEQLSKYSLYNCAYIGDDIPDLRCMVSIRKYGGVTACPSDAISQIKRESDYICKLKGGDGAVREFIDWLTEK